MRYPLMIGAAPSGDGDIAVIGFRFARGGRAAGTFIIAGAFLSLVAVGGFGKLPALILWGYLAVSLLTFLMYAYDKTAAKDGAPGASRKAHSTYCH